jgi:hypothetical protein
MHGLNVLWTPLPRLAGQLLARNLPHADLLSSIQPTKDVRRYPPPKLVHWALSSHHLEYRLSQTCGPRRDRWVVVGDQRWARPTSDKEGGRGIELKRKGLLAGDRYVDRLVARRLWRGRKQAQPRQGLGEAGSFGERKRDHGIPLFTFVYISLLSVDAEYNHNPRGAASLLVALGADWGKFGVLGWQRLGSRRDR